MKVFVAKGENNTWKTTRIRAFSRKLDEFLSSQKDEYKLLSRKYPRLKEETHGPLVRKYVIASRTTGKVVRVTIVSEGDSEASVKKSIQLAEEYNSDIHVMASRPKCWNVEWNQKFDVEPLETTKDRPSPTDIQSMMNGIINAIQQKLM